MKTEIFKYLDPHMEEISIGTLGTILDEPKGVKIKPFKRNDYICFYDPYHRENVPLHRAMAEAFTGKPIPEGHSVRFLNGNREDCRVDNLFILAPHSAPFSLFLKETRSRTDFETFADMRSFLIPLFPVTKKGTAVTNALRAGLSGRRTDIRGYMAMQQVDINPAYPDPWNHRPVVQVDFADRILARYSDMPQALDALGIADAKKRALVSALSVMDTGRATVHGFHLVYQSEHARRTKLSSFNS